MSSSPRLPIECMADITGAFSGQLNGTITARTIADEPDLPAGSCVGTLEYSLYDGRLLVGGVGIPAHARRRGVATALYEHLLALHPDAVLERGTLTDLGLAFRAWFDARHADRLALVAPDRPGAFTEEQYEQLRACVAQLQIQPGADAATRTAVHELFNDLHDFDYAIALLPPVGGRWSPEDQSVLDDLAKRHAILSERLRTVIATGLPPVGSSTPTPGVQRPTPVSPTRRTSRVRT